MPLFKCAKCGCIENTALGLWWLRDKPEFYDWTGLEEFKGKGLCSECAPKRFSNGEPTRFGKWHGKFKKEPWRDELHMPFDYNSDKDD